jgi:hypothetical protein
MEFGMLMRGVFDKILNESLVPKHYYGFQGNVTYEFTKK